MCNISNSLFACRCNKMAGRQIFGGINKSTKVFSVLWCWGRGRVGTIMSVVTNMPTKFIPHIFIVHYLHAKLLELGNVGSIFSLEFCHFPTNSQNHHADFHKN